MGTIPQQLEDVGYNNAVVKMDVEALVRESMIRLFKVTDDNGNTMDSYNDAYNDKGLPTSNDPGAATVIRQFILLEGKILGFIFQQYLYMVKPIQVALELGSYLSQPKKLVEKIKEIIEGIKDLINDVTTFFTDTKTWFTDSILKEFSEINIPIPEIPLNLLGFEIPIPSIDNNKLFESNTWKSKGLPNPYKENNTTEVNNISNQIKEQRKKLQTLEDNSNGNIDSLQTSMLNTLLATLPLLYSTLYEETDDYVTTMKKVHGKVLDKQVLVIAAMKTKKVGYKIIDYTNDINKLVNSIMTYTESNYLKTPTDISKLETLADTLAEMIDDEEQTITDTINNYKLKTNKTFEKKIKSIDDDISDLLSTAHTYYLEITNTNGDITEKNTEINNLKSNLKTVIPVDITVITQKDEIQKIIKDLKNQLSSLSPATAWMQAVTDLILGIIRSPFDFIISLVSELFQGILELLKQLPTPKFTKIKEFFSDLINIPNIDKMSETLTKLLDIPEELADTVTNVMEFLPWLIVTVATQFVTSIASPLPIPIS